jgi:hypothetical protein
VLRVIYLTSFTDKKACESRYANEEGETGIENAIEELRETVAQSRDMNELVPNSPRCYLNTEYN